MFIIFLTMRREGYFCKNVVIVAWNLKRYIYESSQVIFFMFPSFSF